MQIELATALASSINDMKSKIKSNRLEYEKLLDESLWCNRYANKKIEKFTIKRFCHLRAICIIFKTLLWLKFNIRLLFYLYDSSISMLKNASTRVNSAEGNLNSYRLGGCMYTVVEYSCTSLNKCFPPSEIFVSIPSALWHYRSDDDDNY